MMSLSLRLILSFWYLRFCFGNWFIPNISSVAPCTRLNRLVILLMEVTLLFGWLTPGVVGSNEPLLIKSWSFSHSFSGHSSHHEDCFQLYGANIIDGFRESGYITVGTGSVDWFDPSTDTGALLGAPFDHFYFAGNTWSLGDQLAWIESKLTDTPDNQPRFVFLNVGETHVPYWHQGASWQRWPSPCVPFGDNNSSAEQCRFRQRSCLEWVDHQLASLLDRFCDGTVLICADHGDCWGEDGLWEHGISHSATLTVPLLLRVRGVPLVSSFKTSPTHPSPSRFRSVASLLKQWLKARLWAEP